MVSMDSSTRKAIGELDGLINTRAALASWEESLAAPYDGREVWVHSDLKPNNLLVSAKGRLTAVIDFETCGVGDPACDLFPVWYVLPANVRDEFRAALDMDDVTWLRGRGRVLSQALGYLRDYRDTNPALANLARHAIGEVLSPLCGTLSAGPRTGGGGPTPCWRGRRPCLDDRKESPHRRAARRRVARRCVLARRCPPLGRCGGQGAIRRRGIPLVDHD